MTDEDNRQEFLDVMEERRAAADTFAWAVPAVVVASQAFILTIALDPDAAAWTRLIASAAGVVTLLGAWHQFTKQTFHFALYEAVIKRERKALFQPLVDRDSLLANAKTLDPDFQDEWLKKGQNGELVPITKGRRTLYAPKWPILIPARQLWPIIFGVILALDVGLALWALYDLLDLDLFGSEPDDQRHRFPFGDD